MSISNSHLNKSGEERQVTLPLGAEKFSGKEKKL